MKVLHVESGRHLYGGPAQVLLLLRGLRAKGVENVLVCPTGSAIAGAGPEAELREISMRGDADLGLISRLRRIITATRPDLVHLHSRRGADWIGGLASLRLGVPVVLSRRVDNREPRLFSAAKYALVDHIIAVSQAIESILLDAGIDKAKVSCVHDAVGGQQQVRRDRLWLEEQFAIPPFAPVIGIIAQLIPRKGHRYFLEAMPGLLQSFKNLRVLFCGQGACEKEIRGQIERMGLGHAVTLAGFRNDLDKILPCLDLLVHPATSEGLGVSLLQASQAGLPVVASNVGGIPEAISDGISGLLVPPENPVELQRAVERILNDSLLAQRLGNQGIDHVKKNFSVEKMVDGNLAVYNLV